MYIQKYIIQYFRVSNKILQNVKPMLTKGVDYRLGVHFV